MSARANASSSGSMAPNTSQYLTFVLGKEAFAIGILAIKEIIEYESATPVPLMPPSVHGVINLRGAVVPVIDLSVRFGRPASTIGKRSCIVIVEFEADGDQQKAGVLVDAVSAVLDIDAADIEPPPAFGSGVSTDFMQGMAKLNSGFVILLDIVRIASSMVLGGPAETTSIAGGRVA